MSLELQIRRASQGQILDECKEMVRVLQAEEKCVQKHMLKKLDSIIFKQLKEVNLSQVFEVVSSERRARNGEWNKGHAGPFKPSKAV